MLKVHGLEAALVDHSVMSIGALEEIDGRVFSIKVAGPTALLISKTIKISERVEAGALERGRADRVSPKDALDVLRLLQAIPTARLAEGFVGLAGDEVAPRPNEEISSGMKTSDASIAATCDGPFASVFVTRRRFSPGTPMRADPCALSFTCLDSSRLPPRAALPHRPRHQTTVPILRAVPYRSSRPFARLHCPQAPSLCRIRVC